VSAQLIHWESWELAAASDREFRRITLILAVPALLLALIIPWINLPGPAHEIKTYAPPPLVVELAEPQPKKVVEPKPEAKVNPVKPPEVPPPKPIERPPPPKPPEPTKEEKTAQARKEAQQAL